MSKGVYRFIVVYYIFFTSFPLYINSRFKRIVSIKKKNLEKNKSDLFLSFHHSYIDYCNNNYYYYYYCIIIKHERLRRFQSSSYILNHSSLSRCVWGGDWSSSTCKFIVLDCDIFVCFFFFSRFFYIYMRIKNRSKPHHSRLIIFIKFSTSTSIQSSLREFQPRFRNIEEKQLLF